MIGELTTDQEDVLKEIPGYVRIEMLERWIRYHIDHTHLYGDGYCGWGLALLKLEADIIDGSLNDNERFKV